MNKKQRTREVLFSSRGPLTLDQMTELVAIGADMLGSTKDKALVVNSLRHCFCSIDDGTMSSQILHYFSKWSQDDRKQVREFILSELAELIRLASMGMIGFDDLVSSVNKAEVQQRLKIYHRPIKNEIQRMLIKKFGPSYEDMTAKRLGISKYAVVRLFREDRVPTRETLMALMQTLDVEEIQYRKI